MSDTYRADADVIQGGRSIRRKPTRRRPVLIASSISATPKCLILPIASRVACAKESLNGQEWQDGDFTRYFGPRREE
jgi:hypothetical protein